LLAAALASGAARAGDGAGPGERAGVCPPSGWTVARLKAWPAADFALPAGSDADALALALLPCLAARDPAPRDGVAFEALSRWMRADALSPATRARLLDRLLPVLAPGAADPDGVRRPFAALVLSEVARTDRKAAWMRPAQREALVRATADYMRGIRDHRGFEAGVGWRHGVAHTADLMLQLALNPQVGRVQLDVLLSALATQVAPEGHAYVFGEPERLARPVLYAAARNLHSDAEWRAWLDRIAAPAPYADWRAAGGSEAGLAKRHDTRAFLLALYAGARDAADPAVLRLAPMAKALLDASE
jgi:hypothetical protein